MRIEFSPEFHKYVGFLDYVEIPDSKTVGNTLQELFNRFPSLLMFLVDKEYTESKKTSLKLNGEYIFEFADLETKVSDTDVLAFGRDVPEGAGAAGKLIAGVALMGLALAFPGFAPFGYSIMGHVFAMGAGLAIGGLAEAIIGQPKIPSFTSDGGSDSPSYSFGSIPNTTATGTPIGIVYGRHRIGGHLLNVYTDVRNKSNFLHMQLGLCEGPILDINSDFIKINGKDLTAYNDVVIHRRLGTKLQEYDKPVYDTLVADAAPKVEFGAPYQTIPATPAYFSIDSPVACTGVALNLSINVSLPPGTSKTILSEVRNKIKIQVNCVLVSTGATTITYINLSQTDFEPNSNVVKTKYIYVPVGEYSFNITLLTPEIYAHRPGTINGLVAVGASLINYTLINNSTEYVDSDGAMYRFTDTRNTIDKNVVIPYDPTPDVDIPDGTLITTSKEVNKVDLVIYAPSFYYTGNAGLEFTTVTYRIYYKLDTDSVYTIYTVDGVSDFTFKEKSKTEVFNSVIVNFPIENGSAIYDIMVVRTTVRHNNNEGDNARYQDELYVKSITEIVVGEFIYPWTALMGLHIKANDQLNGSIPTITSVIEGRVISVPDVLEYDPVTGLRTYSGVWETDGTTHWKQEWSNDPIWCLWDLLTNSRYGLADYFKIDDDKLTLILSRLYLLSQHCAEIVTYVDGGIEYSQNRYSLDLVMDTSKSAIEWINTICGAMNAFVCYTEGYLYIDIDRGSRPITQIFNMSNIREFKQSGGSYKEIPNCYEVQFANEVDNKYEMDVFRLEANELQTDSTIEERKKTLNLIGVTNIHRCKRIAKKLLLQGQRATTTVSFKTGTHALQSMIGDVIGVQHDVPQWGFDGVVQAYDSINKIVTLSEYELFGDAASYSIIFSQGGRITNSVAVTKPTAWSYNEGSPVTHTYNTVYLHNGRLYKAKSTHTSTLETEPEVGVDWETKWRVNYTITLAENPTFTDDSLCTPVKGDTCIIGETSNEVKPFKLINIVRDPDEQISLTCVEYVESIYTDSDSLADLDTAPIDYYTQLELPTKKSITNFVAEPITYTSSSGSVLTGIDCWYTPPVDDIFWKGTIIKYALVGSTNYEQIAIDNTGYVRIPSVDIAGTYQVLACAVYNDGTQQSVSEVLNATLASPYANVVVDFEAADAAFLAGVQGLTIAGQDVSSDEFTGKSCTFTWNKRAGADFAVGVGSIGTATTNANDSNFGYYLVEILDAVDSVTARRTAKIYDEQYTYSHEDNHADGLTRSFTIRVTIVNRFGTASAPAIKSVTNPVPVALV